ncbi:DUF6161 domain-containing protein [Sphingobium sp. CAP-1]|uniref:DUF6161 domain-containing protein n=1 Tax=Sphingobium sp. CAP-1 TaxID=2676077 RepID=UPI0012BB378B|nr:DUF6161 domain-containing protein [Sphingobium sp. CAP-1]QGP77771.1 hypothetical protein GL174_01245 [Sphingobium sp. CAP-1]
MVEIVVGNTRYSFNRTIDIAHHAKEQSRLWQHRIDNPTSPIRRLQGNVKRYAEQMATAWSLLEEAIINRFGVEIEDDEINELEQLCASVPFVDYQSFQDSDRQVSGNDTSVLERAVTSFRNRFVPAPTDIAIRLSDNTQRTPAEVGELYDRVIALRREVEELENSAQQKAAHVMASVEQWKSNLEADFSDIQSAYREQMEINEPIKLWKNRMNFHEKNRQRYLIAAITFGMTTIFIPTCLGISLFEWNMMLPDRTAVDATVQVIFKSSLTLLVLTLLLWATRLCVRFYMIEQHLALDAAARSTMVETYLGLRTENALESTDRAIVLGALFRPVTDGLVNDDAMPLTSAAALATAALTRNPKAG